MTQAVYVAVTGGGLEYGICRDSITRLELPDGSMVRHARGTKGYEARQKHFNSFIDSDFEWMVMLDADMVFPADTVTRLMAHGLPFVSGLYLFRQTDPMRGPIWFHAPDGDSWPMRPFIEDPERGRLHELGASGWGCILIHRSAIEDTRLLLRGEGDVLEDDMDVWPYDLKRVMQAINSLQDMTWAGLVDVKALERHVDMLADEIRPLRGINKGGGDIVGSDVRFAWFARQAGYPLWGDPDVRCGHVLDYSLHPDEYSQSYAALSAEQQAEIVDTVLTGAAGMHADFQRDMTELAGSVDIQHPDGLEIVDGKLRASEQRAEFLREFARHGGVA